MKKFITITLFFLLACGAAFYIISMPRNTISVQAVAGVIDLTGNDFEMNIFRLDGEWEFYFNKLYTPEDFFGGKPEAGSIITVPSSWDEAGYPLHGFATYRLTVLTNEPDKLLLIPEIYDASVVWINGYKVFEAGKVSGVEQGHKTSVRNAFVNVRANQQYNDLITGQFEIIIQAENYNWIGSGLNYSIELGRTDVLFGDAGMRRILTAVFIGMLIAMFIYHGILFMYRRREWAYLIFALFCITGAIRFTLETNGLAVLFLKNGLGAGLAQLHTLLFTIQAFLLLMFTHIIFDISFKSKIRLTIYGVVFGLPLILVSLPYGVITPYVPIIFIIPLIMIFINALRSKRLKDNLYYYLYVIALAMYIILPFVLFFGFANRLYMAPIAHSLFLILSQCLILSISYTETKRREEEFAEQNRLLDSFNRAKTNFLQDMSHEMKTPLAIIAAGIDFTDSILREDNVDIKEARETLGSIQEETQRIGRMVSGMIEMASMDDSSGKRCRVDFAMLLKNSVEAFRITLPDKNRLRLEIAPGLPDVYVESDGFNQVITNLLTNSVTYSQGDISITANLNGKYITVQIADTGESIPPGLLDNVFRRGVSGTGGTGYGLYICKTIVEAHGGEIEMQSNPGDGTTVTFTVPVYGGQEGAHLT